MGKFYYNNPGNIILNGNSRFITLAHVAECIVLCVFVCVLPQNCCSNSIISKFKQATSHKLGNLRQTVVLYKTGKFLQANVA